MGAASGVGAIAGAFDGPAIGSEVGAMSVGGTGAIAGGAGEFVGGIGSVEGGADVGSCCAIG